MALQEHLHAAIRKHAMQDKEGAKTHLKGDVSEMTIEKAENGFLVTHRHKESGKMNETFKPPEKHMFDKSGHHIGTGKNMHEHMQEFMGCEEPEEAETGRATDKTRKSEGGKIHKSGKDTEKRVI